MEQLQKKIETNELKDIVKRGLLGLSIPLISMTYPMLNQYRGNTNDLFTFVNVLAGLIFACILYFSFENLKFNFHKDQSITYTE